MALSQRLEFRQTQGLVMTPQLMQAIKLLQLSSLDLVAYVEGELERNPLLERASDDDPPVPGAEAGGTAPERSEDGPATADWMDADLETSRSSMEQGLGTELENVFPDDGGEKRQGLRRRHHRPIQNGRAQVRAATVKTTISRRSSRPRRPSPITSPNKWRWRFPVRRAG
ncbi:MAG TPA: hypothetical protein VN692_04595 [Steroidobacteraceae bacterium]|nr:hypothetical protein [Steroidobacteraceae bacterium]